VVNAPQIIPDLFRVVPDFKGIGKGTLGQVILIRRRQIAPLIKGRTILLKRQGQHGYFHISPGKKGGQFAGQEPGIGTGYIEIDVSGLKKKKFALNGGQSTFFSEIAILLKLNQNVSYRRIRI
jgi:hypothetical protein